MSIVARRAGKIAIKNNHGLSELRVIGFMNQPLVGIVVYEIKPDLVILINLLN